MSEAKYHVVVVVLGDLGRSPRMMYHVLSLLEAGYTVSFCGYAGEELITPLQNNQPNLQTIRFYAPKLKFLKSFPLLYFSWRLVSLTLLLSLSLCRLRKVDGFLVQNPPAIPLLAVVTFFCYIHNAALIIDWHNLGYSMLQPQGGFFRSFAKAYEKYYAPYGDGHLTVTRALKDFLATEMKVKQNNTSILLDCPPTIFRMRTLKEQHKVLLKVDDQICRACPGYWYATKEEGQTLFTEDAGKRRFYPRKNRPALVVSSTSWTPDEDIGMMIEGLKKLDEYIKKTRSSLRVVCAITGKGPLKTKYEEEIARLTLENVAIVTLWLEPEDYPQFLACADLGISVHTSTSKMDLPIKILDYFGCEVPVAAYKFSSLQELVQDDVNGRTFETSSDLSSILYDLLEPLTQTQTAQNHDFGALKRYSLQVQGRLLWSENWPKNARPVIEQAIKKYR